MKSLRIRNIVCAFLIALISIALYTYYATTAPSDKNGGAVVTIPTRENVKLKFIVIKPDNPTAVVVLFAGAKGNLQLSSFLGRLKMKGKSASNFLVRSRKLFAAQGFVTVVPDSPSDNKEMRPTWRMRPEHLEDVNAVIKTLKKDYNLPVWLIGSSRGTFSASNATLKLSDTVDGLVLCSSVTHVRKKFDHHATHPNGIISMDLPDIEVPTLIVAHKGDRCVASPAANAEKLKNVLANAVNVELKVYIGGKKPEDDHGCTYWGAHSYYGLEEKVVTDIADFIKSN